MLTEPEKGPSAPTDKPNLRTGVSTLNRRIIASTTGVFIAGLAFFGIQGPALDRVVRNHPTETLIITGLVFAGVAIALISQALLTTTVRQVVALLVASACIVVAGAFAVYLSVESKAAKQRPQLNLTATFANGMAVVDFSASAEGLTGRETFSVELEGLHSAQRVYAQVIGQFGTRLGHDEIGPSKRNRLDPTEEYVTRLSYAFIGPDPDGKIKYTGRVEVALGIYERVRLHASVFGDPAETMGAKRCDREALHRGCVALALPQPPLRPKLSATWADVATRRLNAAVDSYGLTVADVVKLIAWQRSGEITTILGAWVLNPDSRGIVDQSVEILVPPAQAQVCLRATLERRALPIPAMSPSSEGRLPPQDIIAPPATVSSRDDPAFGAPRASEACDSGYPTTSALELRAP